tara:strand:+ start:305 stop:436 length:132 start_codon:yes stop_codon:yes gene_type:complete
VRFCGAINAPKFFWKFVTAKSKLLLLVLVSEVDAQNGETARGF